MIAMTDTIRGLREGSSSIRLEAAPASASVARNFIEANAILDSMRRREAALLVTELVSNAIRHADHINEFELSVDGADRRGVKIAVSHTSPGPLSYDSAGAGFTLTDRLARFWGHDYDLGWLSIWFIMRRPGGFGPAEHLSDAQLTEAMEEDPACADVLVRRHSDLAAAIAGRYRGKGISDDDLQQAAMMALLKAIRRYDPVIGDLRPYAAATISGEMKKLLRDAGWSVRVPRSVQERSLATARAAEQVMQREGRQPSVEEVAEHMGLDTGDVAEAMRARMSYSSRSINKESESTGLSISDYLTDGEDVDPTDRLLIAEAVARLPEREARIIALRFYEDKTQDEIAQIVGVSQMHVSRLLKGALRSIRLFIQGDEQASGETSNDIGEGESLTPV